MKELENQPNSFMLCCARQGMVVIENTCDFYKVKPENVDVDNVDPLLVDIDD